MYYTVLQMYCINENKGTVLNCHGNNIRMPKKEKQQQQKKPVVFMQNVLWVL